MPQLTPNENLIFRVLLLLLRQIRYGAWGAEVRTLQREVETVLADDHPPNVPPR